MSSCMPTPNEWNCKYVYSNFFGVGWPSFHSQTSNALWGEMYFVLFKDDEVILCSKETLFKNNGNSIHFTTFRISLIFHVIYGLRFFSTFEWARICLPEPSLSNLFTFLLFMCFCAFHWVKPCCPVAMLPCCNGNVMFCHVDAVSIPFNIHEYLGSIHNILFSYIGLAFAHSIYPDAHSIDWVARIFS